MNKERKRELRQAYHTVAKIGGMGLCNFCKYASWIGDNCCDSAIDCEHPLPVICSDDNPYNVWQGDDCWGFKPDMSLDEAAILSSIYFENNFPHKNKKGEWVAIIPNEYDKETYNL